MIPRIYINEPCPLEGYEDLSVRVLANSTGHEWQEWCQADLGTPGCQECAKLDAPPVARGKRKPKDVATGGVVITTFPPKVVPDTAAAAAEKRYCRRCAAARAAYGRSIVTFYGPTLLGEDVSAPEAALALFDRDDALPSEIVIWLQLVPSQVRDRRTESLLGNLTSSATTPRA
jgi:hypothetical protein